MATSETEGQGQLDPGLDKGLLDEVKRKVESGLCTDYPLPRMEFRKLALHLLKTLAALRMQLGWKPGKENGFWEQVAGKHNFNAQKLKFLKDTGLTYYERTEKGKEFMYTDRSDEKLIALVHLPLDESAETRNDPLKLSRVVKSVMATFGFLREGEALSTSNPRVKMDGDDIFREGFIKSLQSDKYVAGVHFEDIGNRSYATGFTFYYVPAKHR
ncbi:MAG: hypothetical protein Q7S79_04005 [bacterium]|nr:hypothetical protein [bacterium]